MHAPISILTILPAVTATMFGTCTPKPMRTPDFNAIQYPTTLTEVYSCTQNASMIAPPFFDRTIFSNHEQTLTTLQQFPTKPTSFPYTHVITVWGVLSRTEGVGVEQGMGLGLGPGATFLSTVTDVETIVLETGLVKATLV
ncbi:hypothetical protein DE146DRAFT_654603 [Phaeosphaeria sp. MPI-PUGE-AT-0046c]|nr:hypothetical protein DE146DRAFT_654603 [Phaeosphaeria sp. MPI-PUGE-AT-0046c]